MTREPYHDTHIILPGTAPEEQYGTIVTIRNRKLYYSATIFAMSDMIQRRHCAVARSCSGWSAPAYVAPHTLARTVSPAPPSRGAA